MIQLKDSIRDELAGRFDISKDTLKYLAGGREDSDGIVYTFEKQGIRYVLKIACIESGESKDVLSTVDKAMQKLEFARFLSDSGVQIASPLISKNGSIFQSFEESKYTFLASVMRFVEGSCPQPSQINDELLKKWGKLTGRMHAATKKYKLWKNFLNSSYELGYEEEIDSFQKMCRNETVKKHWLLIKQEMAGFEVSRESFGLIHNDNHQNNIIVDDKNITLIDFDCATSHFFIQDIFMPIQGPLFGEIGGFNRPVSDMDAVKRFYHSFLSGYETENHIEDKWLKQLQTFLNYRRLLLYTIMQDWMESDVNVGSSFLTMIENPCEFSV